MSDQTVQPNSTTTAHQHGGAQHSVLEVIARYAPRAMKENRGSVRGHWSMQCPLPGHADKQHWDYSGSFSVDESETLFYCFGCGEKGNAYQLQQFLSGNGFGPAQSFSAPRNFTQT